MTDKTKLPTHWMSFLNDGDNKTELFAVLAETIPVLCPNNVVVVTKREALSNKPINMGG